MAANVASAPVKRPLALITGGARGLGYYASLGIAKAGFDVVLAVRDAEKGSAAAAKLKEAVPDADFAVLPGLECTNVAEVSKFVAEAVHRYQERGVDVLLNNAGVYSYDDDYKADAPGAVARRVATVNYTAPVTLITGLAPILRRQARVINVSSMLGAAHKALPAADGAQAALRQRFVDAAKPEDVTALVEEYVAACSTVPLGATDAEVNGWPVRDPYGITKLALSAYTAVAQQGNAELAAKDVSVNSMCPGYCKTDMTRGGGYKTAEEGADTMVWLASALELRGVNGKHFSDRKESDWRTFKW